MVIATCRILQSNVLQAETSFSLLANESHRGKVVSRRVGSSHGEACGGLPHIRAV